MSVLGRDCDSVSFVLRAWHFGSICGNEPDKLGSHSRKRRRNLLEVTQLTGGRTGMGSHFPTGIFLAHLTECLGWLRS